MSINNIELAADQVFYLYGKPCKSLFLSMACYRCSKRQNSLRF